MADFQWISTYLPVGRCGYLRVNIKVVYIHVVNYRYLFADYLLIQVADSRPPQYQHMSYCFIHYLGRYRYLLYLSAVGTGSYLYTVNIIATSRRAE